MANNNRRNTRRKNKRRIMRSLTINEMSGVDIPAQEGAAMVIMKRAHDEDMLDDDEESSMENDKSKDSRDKNARKGSTTVETEMDEKEVQKMIDDALAKASEGHQAELAKAKAFGELTDVQKSHYGDLNEDEQAAFLKLSPEDRQSAVDAAIAKRNAADPVVYTAADGTEYHKSDDPRLVKMAKRDDEREVELTKLRETNETASLEKRAGELEHLPGTLEDKVEMLKAIDAIPNEEARKRSLEALKSQNTDMAKAFETHGVRPGDASVASAPEQELASLAKKYAAEHSVSEADAYVKVLETPEGSRLYEASVQQ